MQLRENKFKGHVSKNVAKMAILWLKIGQRHFSARTSHGHNLAKFHPILTNEYFYMTSSSYKIFPCVLKSSSRQME